MTDKLKLAAGALIMWLAVCPVEAKVCFLPSEGCGLKNPNDEPGPTPECTGDWKKGDCSGFRDKTLYSCETMGNCYKYSCLYKSFESCAEASSTKYCEQDSSSGCYKSATNPNPNPNPADDCEGYDDEYNESCACTQCPSDSSRYSCNCTGEMSCKKYGESLGKVYDTLSDLSCSNSQVYEPTGDTKKGEACYYCRNKTCVDYDDEFEKGKGNCGANEKEEQDTSTGCYKCVDKTCKDYGEFEKGKGNCGTGYEETAGTHSGCYKCSPVESNEVCFKVNYRCNGTECLDSDTKYQTFKSSFSDIDSSGYTGDYGDEDFRNANVTINTDKQNKENTYCVSREKVINKINERVEKVKSDKTWGILPQNDFLPFELFSLVISPDSKYNSEINYEYRIYGSDDSSDYLGILTTFMYQNKLYYSYEDEYDAYGYCTELMYQSNNDSGDENGNEHYPYATAEQMISCLLDNGFVELPTSKTIPIYIDLFGGYSGAPKCIYFTATCPDLENNGGNAGYCIDRISTYVEDSLGENRVGISYDYKKNVYDTDSSDVTFNFSNIAKIDEKDKNKVVFELCGGGTAENNFQDWDVIKVTVTPNRSTDSYGKGAYIYPEGNDCYMLDANGDKLFNNDIYGNKIYLTYKNEHFNNLCTSKEFRYKRGETNKSETFVPFVKYYIASKVEGGKTNLYCKTEATVNRKFDEDVFMNGQVYGKTYDVACNSTGKQTDSIGFSQYGTNSLVLKSCGYRNYTDAPTMECWDTVEGPTGFNLSTCGGKLQCTVNSLSINGYGQKSGYYYFIDKQDGYGFY